MYLGIIQNGEDRCPMEFGPIYSFSYSNSSISSFDCKTITSGCQALLRHLRSFDERFCLSKSYRIQLLEDGSKTSLQLCLDPLQWYGYIKENHPNDYIRMADEFVDFAYKSAEKLPQAPKKEARNECWYNKTACPYKGNCERLHKEWTCHADVDHVISGTRVCKFSDYKESIFDNFKNAKWDLMNRREYTRDLLLVPKSYYIKTGDLPHSNIDLIQCEDFWGTVKEAVQFIASISNDQKPVTRVVINFGFWETAVHKDPYLKECHAHAHLWLTPSSVRNIKALELHDFPPEDYLYINAKELQNGRLMHDKVNKMAYNHEILLNQQENMATKMDKILSKLGIN